ncbi:MAG: 2,3-bisphosphoglycerate-independent phosphoglycerate mutase [Patescibacteria group bacterium]
MKINTEKFLTSKLKGKVKLQGPVVLVVLDGFGLSKNRKGNAVSLAKAPNFARLWKEYPHTQLEASGRAVGLVNHQDGNSEAGHMNIGAGRVVEQDPVRINRAIREGTFFKNPAFKHAVRHAQKYTGALHIMGMLGNRESAHAYPDHLHALLKFAHMEGVQKVYLHLFTDGRDSPPHAAMTLIHRLRRQMFPEQQIATIIGRYYAMERAKRWPVTELAYNALVGGGKKCLCADTPEEAILQAYNRNETDEFIQPTMILPKARIQSGDSVIFFNLRSDRARQITKPFVQKKFTQENPGSFKRKKILRNLLFVSMADFGPDLDHVVSAFPAVQIPDSLPIALSELRQLFIAESEKYAHVTYFINGGYADPVNGEVRIKVESPHVAHYDLTPEMSAKQITDIVLRYIKYNSFDFFCINFANADMVAHTGNVSATIHAIEEIDVELGRLHAAVKQSKGLLVITADHGNAEEMINLATGEADTEHSTNPVPLIMTAPGITFKQRNHAVLGDIAPTLLHVLGLSIPKDMTGKKLC